MICIVVFIDTIPEPWYYSQKSILMIVLGCLLASTAVTTLAIFFICISSRLSKAKLKAKGMYDLIIRVGDRENKNLNEKPSGAHSEFILFCNGQLCFG